jgi:hypothetical protein
LNCKIRKNGERSIKNIKNIDDLLNWKDVNRIIIELDDGIIELCGYGEMLESLSDPQKTFFFNQRLEKEVNNGGLINIS